jgi:hypothetical protein
MRLNSWHGLSPFRTAMPGRSTLTDDEPGT